MAPAEPRPSQVPPHLIERIHALVRTSQRMLTEIGREPTPQELAERLRMPVEKVRRLLEIGRSPINLRMAASREC
jgi:RNA polymerase primary sigma factor